MPGYTHVRALTKASVGGDLRHARIEDDILLNTQLERSSCYKHFLPENGDAGEAAGRPNAASDEEEEHPRPEPHDEHGNAVPTTASIHCCGLGRAGTPRSVHSIKPHGACICSDRSALGVELGVQVELGLIHFAAVVFLGQSWRRRLSEFHSTQTRAMPSLRWLRCGQPSRPQRCSGSHRHGGCVEGHREGQSGQQGLTGARLALALQIGSSRSSFSTLSTLLQQSTGKRCANSAPEPRYRAQRLGSRSRMQRSESFRLAYCLV